MFKIYKQVCKQCNIDPNWLFYGGTSAGASLILKSAYTNDLLQVLFFTRESITYLEVLKPQVIIIRTNIL